MSEKEALQVQKIDPGLGAINVRDSNLDVTLGLVGIQGQWSMEKAKKKLSHAVEQLLRAARGELRMAPQGLDWGESKQRGKVFEYVGATLEKVDPHSEHVITKKWLQDHLRGFKTNFRRGSWVLARFPEGEPVDVPTYLKEHGNPEAADRWTVMHEQHKDRFKNQPEGADEADKEAKTMSAMDELKKLATWETGHIDEDDELPEGEGSLIPGLEERRGSTILAFLEPDDDMDETEMIVITGSLPDSASLEVEAQGSELPGDELVGRFEEGKPADPCENMTEAECEEWKANTQKYKDKFDKGAMDELEKLAGVEKEAISQETSDFVEWAINQTPMTKNETIRMLKAAGLKEILPPRQKRSGPRFQQGDDVLIKAHKHKNKATEEPYLENDGKVGVVVGLEGDGVFVQFKSGQPVLFPDAQKTRGVGIYKYTPAFVMQGSKKLELIYESGGKGNPDRIIVVEQYMGRGKTVKRKAPYFTGHAFNARYNKKGGVYFTLFPQQRIAVNPQGGTTEAGFEATSINPEVGRLYYMGLFGRRPSGWQVDLEDMRAGKMVMATTRALERMAGVIPGIPDGTGPHGGTPECQMSEENEGPGDEMMGRFEEGKPADPCENMTDEECEEWRSNTEKYKDKFDKSASMGKTAGYTNYWKIKEPFTPEEWATIKLAASKAWDMGRRMKKIPPNSAVWDKAFADYVAKNGVVLKGPNGSGRPQITDDYIGFNGDGSARISVEMDSPTGNPWEYSTDLAHESFDFENRKGSGYCKTERKPYDMAVASVLWWAKKVAPKKIDIGSDDGNPIKIFATDKEAAEIADVSERAFNWFSEIGKKFDSLPWDKAIDGLGRAISNKSRAEDVLDDFTDLDKSKMNAMLGKGGEKKLKKWLKDTFKKRGSMDEEPRRKRMTARKQMLLPKAIRSKIPKLYSQDGVADPIAYVKFFNPYGRGTWLITEFDGRDTMFGLADLGHPELGYVSLSELESLERMPGLQQIERDSSFRPMPLSEAAKKNGIRWSPPRVASKREGEKKNWIPKDLEKGRCTPGSPNYDCPKGSPQYNLAQTFKKHPEWGEKGGKKAGGETICSWCHKPIKGEKKVVSGFNMHPSCAKKADKRGKKARERMTQRRKEAAREPGGMYGFPKKIQADCESASRKLAKAAIATAKAAYKKDERVARFLATHAERSGSLSAQILVKAMQEIGPRIAAETKKQARLRELRAQRGVEAMPRYDFDQADLDEAFGALGKALRRQKLPMEDGGTYRSNPDEFMLMDEHQGHWRFKHSGSRNYVLVNKRTGKLIIPALNKPFFMGTFFKYGSDKTAGKAKYGLYGYKARTADLGLKSCNAIRREAGRIAADLHGRRAAKHARITEFLKNRSKRGRCLYSRMLVRSYPDADVKIASVKPASVNEWLAWED